MARYMNTYDVIACLIRGGRIIESVPAVCGRTKYKVQILHDGPAPFKEVGRITSTQFYALVRRGIAEFTGESGTDKYGTIGNRYYLGRKF